MIPSKRLTAGCLSLVALVLLRGEGSGGCGEPIFDNPGFDLWCGNELCAWTVDKGKIRRVPTWHRSDYGAELLGDPVVISQLSPITSADTNCLDFRLQADLDQGVSLVLEMDFLDDGSVEYSHPLASDDWIPASYKITPPSWFDKVRCIVRKRGSGRAVLTQIKVTKGGDCKEGPLDLKGRPEGAPCEGADQCKSGRCEPVQQWRPDVDGAFVRACSGCSKDAHCSAAEVCGLESGSEPWLYMGCGSAKRHGFAARCMAGEECGSGVCCEGVCSECCDSQGCLPGGTCALRDWQSLGEDYEYQILPWQCSPGQGLGVAGAPCLKDDDCSSGSCSGTGQLKQCFLDGRPCQSGDDCPLWNTCLTMGEAGGLCQ